MNQQPPASPGGSPAVARDPMRELAVARRTARFALVTAAAAVVVALLAVVMAAVAIGSGGSDQVAGPTEPGTSTESTAADASTAPDDGADSTVDRTTTVARSTGPVEPEADFELAYEKQTLRVQAPGACGEQRFVDFDEPRVGVDRATAEFGYGDDCGVGKPRLLVTATDAKLSRGTAGGTARDCAEEIRNGPINDGRVLQAGDSYCLVTSPSQAEDEGIDLRVVLLTVLEVATADNMVVIEATAWRVPR